MKRLAILACAAALCTALCAPANAAYRIQLENDTLYVTDADSGLLVSAYPVSSVLLREQDRDALTAGIVVQNRESVFATVEDFSS